jgi:hypothetical protein
MPELTPTGAVDVVQRQVRRVRRRKNLYEAQRALYLAIATGAVAALILLPLALYASTGTFAIAAWSTVAILAGIALVLGGGLRRRWIAARSVLVWIENRSALGGRVRTLLELAERPGTRPGFFHALLVAQIGHDLETWEPRRLVPRRVPRMALGTALVASFVLAAALRLASLAAPAAPTVSFADQAAGGTHADSLNGALTGERVVVAPGVPSNDRSARAAAERDDDSSLTSLPSALQENVRQQVWGKAWERVRDALAQVGTPSGTAAKAGNDATEQDGADASEEWEIARAPSGELTRRRRPGVGHQQETPTDGAGESSGSGNASAPADAANDEGADGENGGGAGNGTSPGDLFAGSAVDTGHGDGSFELSLAARMRADRGAGRRGGATAPDADPDAKPALAGDQRRESAAHRMAVPAAYETVVREVFAHRRAESEQP